jgi:hypothetical protein
MSEPTKIMDPAKIPAGFARISHEMAAALVEWIRSIPDMAPYLPQLVCYVPAAGPRRPARWYANGDWVLAYLGRFGQPKASDEGGANRQAVELALLALGNPDRFLLPDLLERLDPVVKGWLTSPAGRYKLSAILWDLGYEKHRNPGEVMGRWYHKGKQTSAYRKRGDV